jgi:glutamate dehydrogenase (NADP+)
LDDAKNLTKNKVWAVVEAANMPTTAEATDHFEKNEVRFGPAKAVNAGGVAVSGLEMAQDSQRERWTSEKVDKMLWNIMDRIYNQCATAAKEFGQEGNLRVGANLAGFKRVADAVIAQGSV